MRSKVITETVGAPAAGANFSFVPSTTDKTLLLAVTALLTTDSTAGSRRAAIGYKDQSAGVFWSADAVFPQPPSTAVTYSWARGAGAGADTTVVTAERIGLPLPWLRLQPGDTVESFTAVEDTNDQWSAIVYRAIIGDWWEHEAELAHLIEALTIASTG